MITSCICPGYEAVYQCTVNGGGSTIWQGTAMQGCGAGRIVLHHSEFDYRHTTNTTCAFLDQYVASQAILSANNSYTSQLTIHNLSPLVNGSTLECTTAKGLNFASKQLFFTTGTLDNAVTYLYSDILLFSV